MRKLLGNPIAYAALYVVFMIPTYFLPYLRSGAMVAAVGGADPVWISVTYGLQALALGVLMGLAWMRGSVVGKKGWLCVFPALAFVFDLTPVLSIIPFVPTVLHLFAIFLGVSADKSSIGAGGQQAVERNASDPHAV